MDLSELIDTHRGGRSYVELSRDCGGSPTDKRLQQMVRNELKNFPDPSTVVALARGLRVSQSAVVLAAAESLGLDVRTSMPRLVELLPAGASGLSEQTAAAVAHLVRTVLADLDTAEQRPQAPYEPGFDDGPEPTVAGVLEARRKHALRAVAQDGDPSDADRVDELARKARERHDGTPEE